EERLALFGLGVPTVATCRKGKLGARERRGLLEQALRAGATWVDVDRGELDAPMRRLLDRNRAWDKLILSYHNFRETPPVPVLLEIGASLIAAGGKIAKIACLASDPGDAARIMGLYDRIRPLIALGMGPAGVVTRVAAVSLGAPFTYAAMDGGEPTAPGQLTVSELRGLRAVLEGSR
nr:type I 3-dehydroquinate dehydratase [bacterium]